jgi:hypothetical protein
VLSSFNVWSRGTVKPFKIPPLRKHKRCGQPKNDFFDKMKKLIYMCFAISLLLLVCSSSSKPNNENGHWHAVSGVETYLTLDINDSSSITHNHIINAGQRRRESPRVDELGRKFLPSGFYGYHRYSGIYYLKADTLIVIDSINGVQKYVRSDLSHCFISDKYMGLSVKITLEEVSDAVDYEVSYCSYNLFVGKMGEDLSTDYFDSLRNAAPDSVFIQADDVLIRLNGGAKFFESINYRCADSQLPINMNLHVDREVPLDFLKKVDIMVPDSFKVHKVVLVKGRDIGLIELR